MSNLYILEKTLHATQLLKLLDKMYKYGMDQMSIVEDTERTLFCPQTADGQTDGQGETSIPLFNFVEQGVLQWHLWHWPLDHVLLKS